MLFVTYIHVDIRDLSTVAWKARRLGHSRCSAGQNSGERKTSRRNVNTAIFHCFSLQSVNPSSPLSGVVGCWLCKSRQTRQPRERSRSLVVV